MRGVCSTFESRLVPLTNRRLRQPSVSERAVIVRLNGTRRLWACHERERWQAGGYEAERPCWRAIPASSGLLPVAEKGMSRLRRREPIGGNIASP